MVNVITGTLGADTFNETQPGDYQVTLLAEDDLFTLNNSGSVTADGGTGDDTIAFIAGTGGGPSGIALFTGGEGDDVLSNEFGGSSTMYGGTGMDDITVVGAALIYGNQDADDIEVDDALNAVIYGGQGDDSIDVDHGSATVYGGLDNDYIEVEDGTFLIYGNQSDDSIEVYDSNATVYGGQGNDDIDLYGPGNALIYGNMGEDLVRGGPFDDFTGNLTAYGGQGQDTFTGFDAVGGELWGGKGADVFEDLNDFNGTVMGGDGDDLMTDGIDDFNGLAVMGEGDDSVDFDGGTILVYGNQGEDYLEFDPSDDGTDSLFATVFAGQGDDTIDVNTREDSPADDQKGLVIASGNDGVDRFLIGLDTGLVNDSTINSVGTDVTITDFEIGETLTFDGDNGAYNPNAVQVVDDGTDTVLRFSENNAVRAPDTSVTVTLENVTGGFTSVADIQAAGYTIEFV